MGMLYSGLGAFVGKLTPAKRLVFKYTARKMDGVTCSGHDGLRTNRYKGK